MVLTQGGEAEMPDPGVWKDRFDELLVSPIVPSAEEAERVRWRRAMGLVN